MSATELIKNTDPTTRGQHPARTPATGTNNEALGRRASNKRHVDVTDLLSSSPKRTKTEAPPNVIDLTQDDEPITKFISTNRRLPLRPALANVTNRSTGAKTSQKRRKSTHFMREQDIHRESIGTLAKIASKLRASANTLDVDREALRQRWEVDETLQRQSVTDLLAELNEYFTTIESGIYAALEVIEKRLL